MTRLARFSFRAALAAAALSATNHPAQAQAPRVLAQAPCTGDAGGVCAIIDINTVATGTTTIRSFPFTTNAGRAFVQFEGTAFCTNTSTTANAELDFDTQIALTPNASVSGTGPGGARFRELIPVKALINGGSTLNLYSSRVVAFSAAGEHTVYLRLRAVTAQGGPGSCNLYQNRFTVIFFPSPS